MFLTMVNRYALDGFFLHYSLQRMFKPRSTERPHCEFVTPAELDGEIRAAGFSTAMYRGVLLGPMRMLYRISTRVARRIVADARADRRCDLRHAVDNPTCRPSCHDRHAMNVDAPPKVVWSLDFELRWGMHDLLGLDRDRYRKNLEGAREAVPQLLQLFTRRGVRATWATVGALACRNWDDYYRRAPSPPRYAETQLAVSPRYADLDPDGALHFAPELVALVANTEGQDLGTHTFSHLFLGELGVMQVDAAADHAATLALFRERFAVTPTSLVFPRNQVAFLAFYRAQGINAWRDNESSWYYQLTRHTNHPVVRGFRMIDALTPWRARGGAFSDARSPSTLFVRVYLPESAWKLHLARIVTEARRAKQGSVLHFWLHPHNLGADVPRGIRRLEQVLDAIDRHAPRGTVYASMRDLAVPADRV